MSSDLSPVIAATTQWLLRAYPAAPGPLTGILAEAQARQAVTVAAWLRYPTTLDAALVALAGPGGSAHLDWVVGTDAMPRAHDAASPDSKTPEGGEDNAWRTWVDETVASWAACLLTSPALATAAVAALADGEHTAAIPVSFRRLTAPEEPERSAAALLRHPDLIGPVADLHRAQLLARLDPNHDPVSTD